MLLYFFLKSLLSTCTKEIETDKWTELDVEKLYEYC